MKWWKWVIPIAAAAAVPFTFGGSLAALGAGGAAAAGGAASGAAAATGGGLTLAQLLGLGAAGAQVVGGVYGAKQAGKGQQRATDAQAKATADALAYERDVENRRRQEYDQQQVLLKAQWDAEQERMAPRRAAKAALIARVSGQPAPDVPRVMPAGYTGAAQTVGTLAGAPSRVMAPPPVAQPFQPKTLSEIAAWHQWPQQRGY